MSLIDAPVRANALAVGQPFLLAAWWAPSLHRVAVAAAERPGAPLGEYVLPIGALTQVISEVRHDELPITLKLVRRGDDWAFDYLGGPEYFAAAPPPTPPELQSVDQLSTGAEAMLRESLGIAPGQPIPEPLGPLPPSEQPDAPPRFDPLPHTDLSQAEAAPALPPPAPPGPEPLPTAQTAPVPQIPPPVRKGLGAVGDQSVPFPH